VRGSLSRGFSPTFREVADDALVFIGVGDRVVDRWVAAFDGGVERTVRGDGKVGSSSEVRRTSVFVRPELPDAVALSIIARIPPGIER
jgi:hypothetical protein